MGRSGETIKANQFDFMRISRAKFIYKNNIYISLIRRDWVTNSIPCRLDFIYASQSVSFLLCYSQTYSTIVEWLMPKLPSQ